MRSDIVTQGSCCGIHGCQRVTVTHKGGGDMAASVTPKDNQGIETDAILANNPVSVAVGALNPAVGVTISPKDNKGVTAAFSLVCATSQGKWEYLLVNEGEIMLIDGECVMVMRKPRNI